jgi:haloalkane dehalogenase
MDRRDFILTATLSAGALATRATAHGLGLGQAAGPKERLPAGETGVAAFTAERLFADLPQGRIAYVDRGKGPGALFLHGFPLNGYQWRGALDRLSAYRRCIAPDFLGLGYSEPAPGQDLRAPAQAHMVIALLDKLKLDTVDLVANDSGCAVAQLLLARHGRRIRSALLTNGDTEPDCPPQAVLGVIAAAKAGTFAGSFEPCLRDKDLCRHPGQLGGDTFTFPERLRNDTIDMYLAPLAAHPARSNAYGRAAEGNPLAGISTALRQVNSPVRIVWGTGDTIFRPDTPEYLDKLFPNSQGVLRVPGARLFFPEEFPDLIARELRVLWRVGASKGRPSAPVNQ